MTLLFPEEAARTRLMTKLSFIKPSACASDPSELRYEVSFDVKNTGTRAGADAAQVYVDTQTKVMRPAKELEGIFESKFTSRREEESVCKSGPAFALLLRRQHPAMAGGGW